MILLVLYGTFLGRVYRENFLLAMPAGVHIPESLLNGLVGGQLISSILAVSCVTVAFCSNMLMVQDKVSGARADLMVTPVRRSVLAMGYYVASLLATLLVCLVAAGACLIYLSLVGWYLSIWDVLLMLLDVFLLAMFGMALSSIVNSFLSTEGQISAVGTIISAGYGFLCGAYMPISQFGEGLQRVLGFSPVLMAHPFSVTMPWVVCWPRWSPRASRRLSPAPLGRPWTASLISMGTRWGGMPCT